MFFVVYNYTQTYMYVDIGARSTEKKLTSNRYATDPTMNNANYIHACAQTLLVGKRHRDVH